MDYANSKDQLSVQAFQILVQFSKEYLLSDIPSLRSAAQTINQYLNQQSGDGMNEWKGGGLR